MTTPTTTATPINAPPQMSRGEWHERTAISSGLHDLPTVIKHIVGAGYIYTGDRLAVNYDTLAAIEVPAEERQRLAALCGFNQEWGIDARDLDTLRMAIKAFTDPEHEDLRNRLTYLFQKARGYASPSES